MNDLLIGYVESRTVDATLTTAEGVPTLTMVHELPVGPEDAWELLVDPALSATWSPVVGDRRLDAAGPATSRERPDEEPVDAEVLTAEPPRELVHRWGGDVLRWSITSREHGSRITLRQELADPTRASSLAAGWHLCLAGLEARAAGHDVSRPVGQEAARHYGWAQLRDGYDVVFANQHR
ncbi:SRPBCC family protein [Arsenicicoccus dermatophilus]|uniref:SRPBCC family protein n=1 Tax=Arsenicicoccus dermatophilus TaxID=1076331 RepID=UPI001F4CF522|nr:SRPBCC domain-containing protein [Arsenicicoccus dermatophilus]